MLSVRFCCGSAVSVTKATPHPPTCLSLLFAGLLLTNHRAETRSCSQNVAKFSKTFTPKPYRYKNGKPVSRRFELLPHLAVF